MSSNGFRKKQCAWHWQNMISRIDFKRKECSISDFSALAWIGTVALPRKNVSRIKITPPEIPKKNLRRTKATPGDTKKRGRMHGTKSIPPPTPKKKNVWQTKFKLPNVPSIKFIPPETPQRKNALGAPLAMWKNTQRINVVCCYSTHPKSFSGGLCSLLIYRNYKVISNI